MKKLFAFILSALLVVGMFGCAAGFSEGSAITVITREAGSGTRGAFVELVGIETKDASGKKNDNTVVSADVCDSTGIVLTNVSSNINAIGYISMGALNNTVKALEINGVVPTADNVKNGTYSLARPFNIVTKGTLSAEAQDFIAFILSSEGQTVVAANGYIPLDNALPYSGSLTSGKTVTVVGSSSVAPLMEKLKEAYLTVNSGAVIEVQQNDSSSGIKSVTEGVCDIGMASRDLKESEMSAGAVSKAIAIDGIAVIVNPSNTISNLTEEQVRKIYVGEAATWADAKA